MASTWAWPWPRLKTSGSWGMVWKRLCCLKTAVARVASAMSALVAHVPPTSCCLRSTSTLSCTPGIRQIGRGCFRTFGISHDCKSLVVHDAVDHRRNCLEGISWQDLKANCHHHMKEELLEGVLEKEGHPAPPLQPTWRCLPHWSEGAQNHQVEGFECSR